MIFLGIFVLITIVLAILVIKDNSYSDDWDAPCLWVSSIITGILLIACAITVELSVETKGQLYATKQNIETYIIAIDETSKALVKQPYLKENGIGINVENMQHSQVNAGQIKDLRDSIVEYNKKLSGWKAVKSNWYTGAFYLAIPDDLQYITMPKL